MVFTILFGPIVVVLYSHLSKIGNDRQRLQDAVLKVIKTLTFIAIPIAMIVFSIAEPLGIALFGEKWHGIGFVIGVMALMHGFSWVVGMNGEFYRVMGKPSYETVVMGSTLVVYLVAYLVSIQYGFKVFIWTRFGLAFGALFLHLFVLKSVLSISLSRIIIYLIFVSFIATGITFLVSYLSPVSQFNHWLKVIFDGLASTLAIILIMYVVERNSIFKEIKMMERARK